MKQNKNSIFISFQTQDLCLIYFSEKNKKKMITQLLYKNNKKHSENFLTELNMIFHQNNIKFIDIDKIFIVISPGSFMSMRLAHTFIASLLLVNNQIKIYLTSAFLVSFLGFTLTRDLKFTLWKEINISISKTKNLAFKLTIPNSVSRKKLSWAITNYSDNPFEVHEIKKHIVRAKKRINDTFEIHNFHIDNYKTRNYIFSKINVKIIETLVNDYANNSNREILYKILSGESIYNKDFDLLFSQRSLFLNVQKVNDYPNVERFMKL